MKINQRIKVIFILFLGVVIAYFILSDTSETCGRFIYEGEMRTTKVVIYEFYIDGVRHQGSIDDVSLKQNLDELKNFDCIKIEYNNNMTFLNRVIDERVLK